MPSKLGDLSDIPDDNYGYLDSIRFNRFAVTVHGVIRKLGRPTYAEIKRALGENLVERWFQDALDALDGAGVIKRVSDIPPTRYEVAVPREPDRRRYNGTVKENVL